MLAPHGRQSAPRTAHFGSADDGGAYGRSDDA